MAEFTLTSSFNADEIMIYYTPTETGNFLGGSLTAGTTTSTELDFESGTSATLSIPVASDELPEPDGSITITLVADQKMENNQPVTTYGVAASPANAGTVMVQDDDSLPVVSILADSGEVTENVTGGKANFKLTVTGISADTTFTVNATPAEDGDDFITDAVADTAADYAVDFSDSDGDSVYTGELAIDLDNDSTGEATGTFKLTLNTDTASPATYQLGTTTEGTITVLDDDAPELSITGGEQVVEGVGATADFIVSAKTSPNSYITIRYDLSESQNFIHHEGTGKSKILDFTNEATEATLAIALVNDTKFEDNGTITVTLAEDTNTPIRYTATAAPNNQASVNIIDDESLPMIWVSTDSGDVAENAGPARFKMIATGLFETTTLMINATPAEVGVGTDFLTDVVADTAYDFSVEFSDPDGDNIYNGELEVTLDEDSVGEVTGDIKVTLNAKPMIYRLASSIEGVMTVWDNDAPELKISAVTETITEAVGANANFKISAEVSPNEAVTIHYDLAESQNFIDNEGTDKSYNLDFSNNAKEATLPIAITNDNTIEENGTITVTLNADTDSQFEYTLDANVDHTAVVNVVDDDAPVLALTAGDPIIEGKVTAANFMVSTTNSPNKILRVMYNLAESHNFVEKRRTRSTCDVRFHPKRHASQFTDHSN